jgi:DNA modification methylase
MRKPGINPKPISHTPDEYPVSIWQHTASPVWMDINPTNTLQFRSAKDNQDERHICPLQLEVIERALGLWTNEGDTVFSPFAGIGSEGYVSIQTGRKFIGVELKKSYWNMAIKNLNSASKKQLDIFAGGCVAV